MEQNGQHNSCISFIGGVNDYTIFHEGLIRPDMGQGCKYAEVWRLRW